MTKSEATSALESLDEPIASGLEASRKEAVDAVVSGGFTAVVSAGVLTAAIYGLMGPTSVIFGLGACVMGGAGLIRVSKAMKHLLRFGSRTSVIGLGATGLLGGVLAAWPVMAILQILGIWRPPMWVRQAYPITVLGLGVVVLFFTLRALLFWAIPQASQSDADPPEFST